MTNEIIIEDGRYDINNYTQRKNVEVDDSGLILEKAKYQGRDWYLLITMDNKIIKFEFVYETYGDIHDYYAGMKHGYRIALHKNEAFEIMKELEDGKSKS